MTHSQATHTMSTMQNDDINNPLAQLDLLSHQLKELQDLCEKLQVENVSLREQQEELTGQKAELIKKNDMARQRVEAMIARLKSLED